MLKFSIRIFEFYCELFKANNIRSFSIQYKIYGWIVFNRSLIQHLSFTVLRFVQPLMQLPTVNIIQKDVSSLRLSSRPRSRPALPPPLPSSWDWQGVNIGHIGDCSSTTSSYFWLKSGEGVFLLNMESFTIFITVVMNYHLAVH